MSDFTDSMHAKQCARTEYAQQQLARLNQLIRYAKYRTANAYEKHFLNNCLF